jgi:inhibitor of growth protein 4
MHDLDLKNKTILREVDAASDEYLRKVRELSPGQRKDEMEKIQKMFKKAKEHGDDKVILFY